MNTTPETTKQMIEGMFAPRKHLPREQVNPNMSTGMQGAHMYHDRNAFMTF